jgi:hypothetical protein
MGESDFQSYHIIRCKCSVLNKITRQSKGKINKQKLCLRKFYFLFLLLDWLVGWFDCWFVFCFVFCSTGVWTWGAVLIRQALYHLSNIPSLFLL